MESFQETRMHSSRMRTAHSSSHGGICISACWDTPPLGVGLEIPPGCGPGDPPDMGLETPIGQIPQVPP